MTFNIVMAKNSVMPLIAALSLMTLMAVIAVNDPSDKFGNNDPFGYNGCSDHNGCNDNNGSYDHNGCNSFLDKLDLSVRPGVLT